MTEKRSSKYKTGEDAYTVFPYEEYYNLIYKWFVQYRWQLTDIGESVFAYELAASQYDPTVAPFIPYLKQKIRGHMKNWYIYDGNSNLIHVPILRRPGINYASIKGKYEEFNLSILDGDSKIGDSESTLFDAIADENARSDVYEYTEIIEIIREIIPEVQEKDIPHTDAKKLVYDNLFMLLARGNEHKGDGFRALSEKHNMIRQTIWVAYKGILEKIRIELRKKGIDSPFIDN